MSSELPSSDTLETVALHLLATKYFQMAAYVMLIYDHIITFDEEVERIWKRNISGASVLFLLNRYISPLEFIIIIAAFQESTWPRPVRVDFVILVLFGLKESFVLSVNDSYHLRLPRPSALYQYANVSARVSPVRCAVLNTLNLGPVIMILRVYALYKRNNFILGFLLVIWISGIAVTSVGVSKGIALMWPPPLRGCIDTGRGELFAALWIAPLVTNSFIFLLTLWQSKELYRQPGIARTIYVFVRDGTVYFLLIFVANLISTVIYFAAGPSLRAIGASFCQLVTSTMVSRLVLNLRSPSNLPKSRTSVSTAYPGMTLSELSDLVVGNLGEELDGLDGFFYDGRHSEFYLSECGQDNSQGIEEYMMARNTHF